MMSFRCQTQHHKECSGVTWWHPNARPSDPLADCTCLCHGYRVDLLSWERRAEQLLTGQEP